MKKLQNEVKKYLKDRGWDNLLPVDIAKGIILEGAELLENFQWENFSLVEMKAKKEKHEKIQIELADVMIYCLEMAVLMNWDAEKLVKKKLEMVKKKYPAAVMRNMKRENNNSEAYYQIKRKHRAKANS